jgi:activating signal cointegrator complex subunit 2
MALPAFADVPSPDSQAHLPPEEWQACIDSWILLAEMHLRLSDSDWTRLLDDGSTNVVHFLQSYVLAISNIKAYPGLSRNRSASQLRRLCFLLNHRALTSSIVFADFLSWSYLESLCSVFPRSDELKKLLSNAWKRRPAAVDGGIQAQKNKQIKLLDSQSLADIETIFTQAIPLLHQMPDLAAFLMTGSDLLDSIDATYQKADIGFRKVATMYVYLGFIGLLVGSSPAVSVLSDHLYSLKSVSKPGQPSLLGDIASNTPLLQKIKDIVHPQDTTKAKKLESLLLEYQQPGTVRPKRLVRRKMDKGKDRVDGDFGHGPVGDVHVHRMSLITQVQDLFPELGSGFIVKLLDEYSDNVEQATAHLLDETLPAHLSSLDRALQLHPASGQDHKDLAPRLVPRSAPSERRNIYDNDELDQLTVDTSRLHLGRAGKDLTADAVLADRSTAPNKAAILSALAAFDSDDDERDDTYDVEDVGGTVDTSIDNEEANTDKNEEALFAAYKMSASTFSRDAATRRGRSRMALKSETGMTDEAIEGWAVMLARDPRKLRRLEAKYSTFTGQQNMLERTAYRENEDGDTESSGGEALGGRGRGRGRGRGFGGGRGGRGGATSGPANEAGTQQARQRKEANKGSRANHNRRDQRARKLARGGFAG